MKLGSNGRTNRFAMSNFQVMPNKLLPQASEGYRSSRMKCAQKPYSLPGRRREIYKIALEMVCCTGSDMIWAPVTGRPASLSSEPQMIIVCLMSLLSNYLVL
jgi:hypothetical protein